MELRNLEKREDEFDLTNTLRFMCSNELLNAITELKCAVNLKYFETKFQDLLKGFHYKLPEHKTSVYDAKKEALYHLPAAIEIYISEIMCKVDLLKKELTKSFHSKLLIDQNNHLFKVNKKRLYRHVQNHYESWWEKQKTEILPLLQHDKSTTIEKEFLNGRIFSAQEKVINECQQNIFKLRAIIERIPGEIDSVLHQHTLNGHNINPFLFQNEESITQKELLNDIKKEWFKLGIKVGHITDFSGLLTKANNYTFSICELLEYINTAKKKKFKKHHNENLRYKDLQACLLEKTDELETLKMHFADLALYIERLETCVDIERHAGLVERSQMIRRGLSAKNTFLKSELQKGCEIIVEKIKQAQKCVESQD